ncbi:CsiV family protein [Marinobacter caseinilyticus]|uniref:CsiV family protein n=1 Tax=Marinobacter caseinilyticus TaxID=2692195 RepID=UPI00140BE944|nr:CsiV family protein [Marinobacter caseinilyticus]
MRFFGSLLTGLSASTLSIMLLTSTQAFAQDTSATVAGADALQDNDNAYRAEIVLLKRKAGASTSAEKMASRHPEQTDQQTEPAEKKLWVLGPDNVRQSDLELVPRNELYLNSAIERLERSGRFNVLMSAGWYQSFPPDYKGAPLRVELGDWLEGAEQREIEGRITIERLRFLHVNAELNHWRRADPDPAAPLDPMGNTNVRDGAASTSPVQDNSSDIVLTGGDMQAESSALQTSKLPTELVTWIRETRRMRSEEIHFLDSPTIGLLVFFKKIEPTEDSPPGN